MLRWNTWCVHSTRLCWYVRDVLPQIKCMLMWYISSQCVWISADCIIYIKVGFEEYLFRCPVKVTRVLVKKIMQHQGVMHFDELCRYWFGNILELHGGLSDKLFLRAIS